MSAITRGYPIMIVLFTAGPLPRPSSSWRCFCATTAKRESWRPAVRLGAMPRRRKRRRWDGPWSSHWGYSQLPSGERTFCHGKSPFLIGKPSINGPFSMAMLVHQRVTVCELENGWFTDGLPIKNVVSPCFFFIVMLVYQMVNLI